MSGLIYHPKPFTFGRHLLSAGGEDQTLPAAEGEAGSHPAGRTGRSQQERRHRRLCQEPHPEPQSWQRPWPRQSQPEAEGAGCQGACRPLRPSTTITVRHVCSEPETFLLSPLQCLRLLMHTFNREYSQVSSSASESKVSPSLGPLTPPTDPAVPLNFTAKYLSPSLQSPSAPSSLFHLYSLCPFIYLFNHSTGFPLTFIANNCEVLYSLLWSDTLPATHFCKMLSPPPFLTHSHPSSFLSLGLVSLIQPVLLPHILF